METVNAYLQPRTEPARPQTVDLRDATRTLTVTAAYLLSEEGRKASLLAGGDGRAQQVLTIQVPANRLHIVSVDANGAARLKLRPRYHLDGDNRVVRVDSVPTYDAPPEVEELFREAAKNHQLERAYEAERNASRLKRREADQERRAAVARAFLADPTQRALVHPAPTPRRCFIATENGRMLFDASTDVPPARDVPAEAHRRFRADLRGRKERNQLERAAQMAVHEEKKRFVAEWIAQHGTADQRARQAAGVLPMDEAIEAITDHAFAALANRPRYERDGLDRIQTLVRAHPKYHDVSVAPGDLVVSSANVTTLTSTQWADAQRLKQLLPDATVTIRNHRISWRCDPAIALPAVSTLLISMRIGPLTVRSEILLDTESR